MQGSVYDSTTKFSDEGLGKLIKKMSNTLTWLPHCIKSIRGYDQPVMIDYTHQLKDNIERNLVLSKKQDKKLKMQDEDKYMPRNKNRRRR